jgi:hypothetical protein
MAALAARIDANRGTIEDIDLERSPDCMCSLSGGCVLLCAGDDRRKIAQCYLFIVNQWTVRFAGIGGLRSARWARPLERAGRLTPRCALWST